MSRPIRLRDPSAPATWSDVHSPLGLLAKLRADYLEMVHGLGWSEEEFFERAAFVVLISLSVGIVVT